MGDAIQGSPFTPEQLADWIANADDTKVPNIIACATVSGILSSLFVAVRLVGRWRVYGSYRLHISDWMIVAAWFFSIVSFVSFGMLTPYGGGRHVIYITDPHRLQIFSLLGEASYSVGLGFLKLSILAVYGAIFPSKTFRICLLAVAFFIISWMLTFSLGTILQCVPIARAYDPTLEGYCIHYGRLSLSMGILNIITDFVIIALPIPLVVKLNTTMEKKRLILVTVTEGSSAVIASIARLVYSLDVGSVDGSWTAVSAGYASCAELTVGFLVVSIPVYRKLYQKDVKGQAGGSTGWSYRSDDIPLRQHNFSFRSRGKESKESTGYKGSVATNTHGGDSTQEITRVGSQDCELSHTIVVKASEGDGRGVKTDQWGINVTDDVKQARHAKVGGTWIRISDEVGRQNT